MSRETLDVPHEPPSPLNRDGVHHLVGAGKTVLARRAVLRKGVAFHFSLCETKLNWRSDFSYRPFKPRQHGVLLW